MGNDTKKWHGLIIQNLEAILAVQEIELAGLNFAIDSLFNSPEEKAGAIERRDAVIVEWGKTMTELENARAGFGRAVL
ncbi:MAG: hypothetical protein ABSE96_24115 [Terracidiphilus sp.]|jgi:hypothetical protein